MKTKELNKTWIHNDGRSTTATKVIDLEGKKFLFGYSNGNAFEYFKIDQYDGEKLNTIAGMGDLGIKLDKSAYHLMSEEKQKMRFELLCKRGNEFIKMLNS